MEIQIIIDIFSGRENPVIELEGDEAKATLEGLKPSRKLKKDDLGIPPSSTLGYRGLIIKQKGKKSESKDLPKTFRLVNGDLFGPRLSHRATDENYEDFFCSPRGPTRKINLGRNFPGFLRKEITQFHELRKKYRPKPYPWPLEFNVDVRPSMSQIGGMMEARYNSIIIATIMAATIEQIHTDSLDVQLVQCTLHSLALLWTNSIILVVALR